jgi:hypothetical protein
MTRRKKMRQLVVTIMALMIGATAFGQSGQWKEFTSPVEPVTERFGRWCSQGQKITVPMPKDAFISHIIVTMDRANGDRNFTRVRINGVEKSLIVVPFEQRRRIDPDYPVQIERENPSVELWCEGRASAYLSKVTIYAAKKKNKSRLRFTFQQASYAWEYAEQVIEVIRELQEEHISPTEFKENFFQMKVKASDLIAISRVRGDRPFATGLTALALVEEIDSQKAIILKFLERGSRSRLFDLMVDLKTVRHSLVKTKESR